MHNSNADFEPDRIVTDLQIRCSVQCSCWCIHGYLGSMSPPALLTAQGLASGTTSTGGTSSTALDSSNAALEAASSDLALFASFCAWPTRRRLDTCFCHKSLSYWSCTPSLSRFSRSVSPDHFRDVRASEPKGHQNLLIREISLYFSIAAPKPWR